MIELSMVLVIIGLLAGGVLGGRMLIRASELRSVLTQSDNFISVANTFTDKYFGLPGDITNATVIWGARDADPAQCISRTPTDATATCNGNGDGVIDDTTSGEAFRVWPQLANAGLISGKYIGAATGTRSMMGAGKSGPAGKIVGSYWMIEHPGTVSSGTNLFYGEYGNTLSFLKDQNGNMSHAILSPADAWNLDAKTDDGKPATGKMTVTTNATSAGISLCTNTSDPSNISADYLAASDQVNCGLTFSKSF